MIAVFHSVDAICSLGSFDSLETVSVVKVFRIILLQPRSVLSPRRPTGGVLL